MVQEVTLKKREEVFNTPIVQQTKFWSKVKQELGVDSLAFDFKTADNQKADLLIINQKINNNNSIAYVPYGPELEPDESLHGAFLEELSESLKPLLPKECIMIRYDLFWESYWAKEQDYFDQSKNWLGPPQQRIQELRFNFSSQKWNFKKAPTNNLPSNTLFLDLTKSNELLLKQMKPKTRYNIKLAKRKGVIVKEYQADDLQIWYQLYKETAERNNILIHDKEYFKAVISAKHKENNSSTSIILLVSEVDNIPLSAMFLVISEKRATYLYGASSSRLKNFMGSYALQWAAIKEAKKRGCTEYDMFGIAPNNDSTHPMHGLFRFKCGFGGNIVHTLGSWDYPFDKEGHRYYCAAEITNQGYHL
ncbi:peptidoglycan bridge formation glycyltransferase FemA/FemB family protein [Marinilabiliaceae bacterium ANBcel2]|nr:peptidoglycan bridge formation glycyltransferase FemA/FemB family protein [Marinilabiliaceae bacterium ANBcel2]